MVADPATELKLIAGSTLYEPSLPGKGEKLYFLRWSKTPPPEFLELSKTWADTGLPEEPGHFLFFSYLFSNTQAPAIEGKLRKLLAEPATTAFAWVNYDFQSGDVALSTLLKTKLSPANSPAVDGDTAVKVYPGVQTVVFPDGAAMHGNSAGGALQQVVITYSPEVSPQEPTGAGVALPLAGGPDGKLVGCLCFQGLTNALDVRNPDRVLKSLMQVAMDPLDPVNPSRNYEIFTGKNYFLVRDATGYHLLPA